MGLDDPLRGPDPLGLLAVPTSLVARLCLHGRLLRPTN